MQKQLTIFFVIIVLAFFGLGVRMAMINKSKGEEYKKQVLSQGKYDSTILPYQRGSIVDSKGTTLAYSKKVYNVVLDSSIVNYNEDRKKEGQNFIEATAQALSSCYGLNKSELMSYMSTNHDSKYNVLVKRVEYTEVEKFNNLVQKAKEDDKATNITGVWFEEEYLRYYPNDTLACDVLGYTNSGNAGAYGLEEYYNSTLNGTNGRSYGYLNEELNLERTTIEAVNGQTLVTTIDSNIQRIVESKIHDYNDQYTNYYREGFGANNIGVIVMECKTGNILAMASYPDFDLNDPKNVGRYFTEEQIAQAEEEGKNAQELLASRWKNFCISDTYEPGSVFKPFTVAAGIDSGKMTGEEVYFCGGKLEIGGYKIKCHNRNGDGMMTVRASLAQSCNVALMLMGQQMGKETFLKYFEVFNFGLKTNIDLTGEARTASLVFNENSMGSTELATSTFGQGNNVTMIEMATAFNSLVNGGYYYEPHMVKQLLNSDGAVVENIEPRLLKQTISNSTSEKMTDYLSSVVTEGTGKAARPAGYKIGGKTGTAEVAPRGTGNYVTSFMGFAPLDDPEIIVYTVIDRPNMPDQQNGTKQACIICKEVMTEVLPYMNVFMTEELSEKEIEELEERGLYNAKLVQIEEEDPEEAEAKAQDSVGTEVPKMKIDPSTGYGIDPETGEYLDPTTGYPINPNSSDIQAGSPSTEENTAEPENNNN